MATSWGQLLAEEQAARLSSSSAADDGLLLTSGLKTAGKCRDCNTTLDIGIAAWFNRDGGPGNKITCQKCHQSKVDAAARSTDGTGDAGSAPAAAPKKTVTKQRRKQPKLTKDLLMDRSKGILAVFKAFPKIKFKGKGHEASDLRKLLNKYAEWAHVLLPDMDFSMFATKLEKDFSGNMYVRQRVDFVRNVQQGLCEIDELNDYDLAERADGIHVRVDEDGLEILAPSACHAAAPAVEMTDELRERIERNKQIALDRVAQRRAAAESVGDNGLGAAEPAPAVATEEFDEFAEVEWEPEGCADFEAEADMMDDGFDAFEEMDVQFHRPKCDPPSRAAAESERSALNELPATGSAEKSGELRVKPASGMEAKAKSTSGEAVAVGDVNVAGGLMEGDAEGDVNVAGGLMEGDAEAAAAAERAAAFADAAAMEDGISNHLDETEETLEINFELQ